MVTRRRRLWTKCLGALALIVVGQLSLAIPAEGAVTPSSAFRAGFTRFAEGPVGAMSRPTELVQSNSSEAVFANVDRVYAALGFGFAAACAVLLIVRWSFVVQGPSGNSPSVQPEQTPDPRAAGTATTSLAQQPAAVAEDLDNLPPPTRRLPSFTGEGWGPIVVAIVIASVTAALDFGGALTGEGTATILGALVGYVVAKGHSG
jgi:hypothetical protein